MSGSVWGPPLCPPPFPNMEINLSSPSLIHVSYLRRLNKLTTELSRASRLTKHREQRVTEVMSAPAALMFDCYLT